MNKRKFIIGNSSYQCLWVLALSLLVVGAAPGDEKPAETKAGVVKFEGTWSDLPKGAEGLGTLLANPGVQNELNLNKRQRGALKVTLGSLQDSLTQIQVETLNLSQLNPRDGANFNFVSKQRLTPAFVRQVKRILQPDQVARLEEISRQCYGPSLLAVDSATRKAISLRNDQLVKIRKIFQARQMSRLVGTKLAQQGNLPKNLLDQLPAKPKSEAEAGREIVQLLDENQAKSLADLFGKPFVVDRNLQPSYLTGSDDYRKRLEIMAKAFQVNPR